MIIFKKLLKRKPLIPYAMLILGFTISVPLLFNAILIAMRVEFDYNNYLLQQFSFQTAVFIFIECIIGSFIFLRLIETTKPE